MTSATMGLTKTTPATPNAIKMPNSSKAASSQLASASPDDSSKPRAAADAPDEVGRVALIGAGGLVPASPAAYSALQRAMDLGLSREERLVALQQSLFAPGNDPSSWLDGWHATAVAAQGAALRATPEGDWVDAGVARVLVVQGLDDVLALPVNGRELVARLGARAALIEIANAGHAMLPEQPLAIANALVDFFGRRVGAAARAVQMVNPGRPGPFLGLPFMSELRRAWAINSATTEPS